MTRAGRRMSSSKPQRRPRIRPSDRALLLRALYSAEQFERSYADSLNGCTGADNTKERNRALAEARSMRALRNRLQGWTEEEK